MGETVAWDSLLQVDLSRFQLVVNATPLGSPSAPNESPLINWECVNCSIHLMDLVYTPSPTRLMQLAAQQGWAVQDGSGMLRQQAKKAWDFWKSSGVIPEI
jgi:shikimate dehydrogenase